MSFGLFTAFQKTVDMILGGINDDGILAFINAIGTIFGTIVLLWATIKSIDIAIGNETFIIKDNLRKLLIISIFSSIAFDTEGWIKIITNSVQEIKSVILLGGGSIAQLDNLTDRYNDSIDPIIGQAPWGSGWLIALIFWISFFAMVASSFFALLGAEIILTVSLLFTPIAILGLAFESTHSVFEGWLGSVFGSILTMVFAGMVMSIMGEVATVLVDNVGGMNVPNSYVAAGATLFFALFFFYFMNDVKDLAGKVTGFTCKGAMKALKLASKSKGPKK